MRSSDEGDVTKCLRRLTAGVAGVCASVVVINAMAVIGAPSATAAPPELLSGDFGSFAVKPPVIELSGDGTATAGGPGWRAPDAYVGRPGTSGRPTSYGSIQWSVYNEAHAVGLGTIWLDNGMPDDASGTFYRYSAHVEAQGLQGAHYTSLTVRFAADGVRVIDRYALCKEGTLFVWGGCAGGSASIPIEYCQGPPVFVSGYVVESAVGLSCSAAQSIVHHYRVLPTSSLFRRGHHVEHVDGFRCVSSNYEPKSQSPDLPPFITKGSGYAQCTTGKRGFFFSYAE